jgi:hypothetical protein
MHGSQSGEFASVLIIFCSVCASCGKHLDCILKHVYFLFRDLLGSDILMFQRFLKIGESSMHYASSFLGVSVAITSIHRFSTILLQLPFLKYP